MKKFLRLVAEDILSKYGDCLDRLTVVFPNRRACLFLDSYLLEITGKTMWSPKYMTIQELFSSFSPYQTADELLMVSILHRTYLEIMDKAEQDEPLDAFYHWGRMMLSDFDDIDKNMANAHALLRNIRELKELDMMEEYLTDEQKAALRDFFRNFHTGGSSLKSSFNSIWERIEDIYTAFRNRLFDRGVLYEGALFRDVLENDRLEVEDGSRFVFVGFNVLSEVEKRLFSRLQKMKKASFYWDYDISYIADGNEAGDFLRSNLLDFPNELPRSMFSSMEERKSVELVASPTESAQVRYATEWIRKNLSDEERNTAVVLCNETLLEPLLHSWPDNVREANITMGYPMSSTPLFSFVETLLHAVSKGYSKEKDAYRIDAVRNIMRHPYTSMLSVSALDFLKNLADSHVFYPKAELFSNDEALSILFPKRKSQMEPLEMADYLLSAVNMVGRYFQHLSSSDETVEDPLVPLYRESVFVAAFQISRLRKLVEDGDLNVRTSTLSSFILKYLSACKIPFHGEPAVGLQVIGLLETRNLDFDNIIMLSANEGTLPSSQDDSSLIPYSLKKAFHLTSAEKRNSIYAYNFCRLMQRASKVSLMYNNNTEGLKKGEMSRFLLQYLLEHPSSHEVEQKALSQMQEITPDSLSFLVKTRETRDMLLDRFSPEKSSLYLSPSALNKYIDCPLRFYFRYVAGMDIRDDETDEVDNLAFGNIFHRSAELLYLPFFKSGHAVQKSDIERMLKDEHLLDVTVDTAMKEKLFHIGEQIKDDDERMKFVRHEDMPPLDGTQILSRYVILSYLKSLLRCDSEIAPFKILGLEMKIRKPEDIVYSDSDGTEHSAQIMLGGSIDRLDETIQLSEDGTERRCVRIVDYKTGTTPQSASSVEEIFDQMRNLEDYFVETFFYSHLVGKDIKPDDRPISTNLFYVSRSSKPDYDTKVRIGPRNGKIAVSDYMSQIDGKFTFELGQKLGEMFSLGKDFYATENLKTCSRCDFIGICRKTAKKK